MSQPPRAALYFVAGVVLALVVPFGLLALFRPCSLRATELLLFWSPLLTAAACFFGFQLRSRRSFASAFLRTAILAAVLVVPLLVAVSNLLGATGRAKQTRTVATLRTLGGTYDSQRLNLTAGATSGPPDGWGNATRVFTRPGHYVLVSYGECSEPDTPDPWSYAPGLTTHYAADIVFSDGRFLRRPFGAQN